MIPYLIFIAHPTSAALRRTHCSTSQQHQSPKSRRPYLSGKSRFYNIEKKLGANQNNSSPRMNRYSFMMLANFLIIGRSSAAASALNESLPMDPLLDNWEKEQGLADLLNDMIEASKTTSPTRYPTKSPTEKPTKVSFYHSCLISSPFCVYCAAKVFSLWNYS